MWILRPRGLIHGLESATSFPGLNKVRPQQFFIRLCFILTLCPRSWYLFVLIFQCANAENMRNVTKMEIANARKATSRNKGNVYWLKVCVSLITVELLQTATSLRTATFLADGTTATSLQQSLSSIPKAVEEGFNCNCNITSENTVRFLYSLFRFLKRLHFTSFSHPSHKNHQGSFHLSPSLVNRKCYIFLAPSKIKGDAYSTKPSGHVTLLTSVLLGGLALTT